VPAEVERHRLAGQERRQKVERAGVIEPAVEQDARLAFSSLHAVQLQSADVEQAMVHGRDRIS